jgi:predicted secreted protein
VPATTFARTGALALAALALAATVGPGHLGAQQPGVSGCGAMTTDAPPPPDVQIVNAKLGEPFSLSLDSNPTTGYRWDFAQPLDESVLQLQSSDFQRGQPGLPGAGGTQNWTFLPLCGGATAIHLEYRRPWEPPAPTDRHADYNVVVSQ